MRKRFSTSEPCAPNRRQFLKWLCAGCFSAGVHLALPLPGWAAEASWGVDRQQAGSSYDLSISEFPLEIDGRASAATGINGTVPGPLVRLLEGDVVQLNVRNELETDSSIHWHGILVPYPMDGVPGVNFSGIPPGDTYHYRYRVKQAGTYWYHSHTRFQEQTGAYGPLIIDPREGDPVAYDRDHVIVLSDWAYEDPEWIFRNLNLMGHYYNFQRRTVGDFFQDVRDWGLGAALDERLAWGNMRMSPVDILDVTGFAYTYLLNGNSPDMNWTALFNPGERVRLRFINASTMTNFDVRIPGLDMTMIQADGKFIRPVKVHEFRIGVAETYDALVVPAEDKPYTIFAEAMDRSGYGRATLSPEPGLSAPVPPLRERPYRKLADIGMGGMMKEGKMSKAMMRHEGPVDERSDLPGPSGPKPFTAKGGKASVAMVIKHPRYRLDEPGIGLGEDGWRVLTYDDLRSAEPQQYKAEVDREMTINITANMEKYMFSFDGLKFSEHPGPYLFRHNERLRLWLVNHTMMDHPIHLHGMWMQLENGGGNEDIPYKHTVLVKPGEKLSVRITPIEKGDWAFHCHLLYHMEAGMFQVVRVA